MIHSAVIGKTFFRVALRVSVGVFDVIASGYVESRLSRKKSQLLA